MLKSILTSLTLLSVPLVLYAQNWIEGVSLRTQIIDLPVNIEVTAYCDSMSGEDAEFHLPLPEVSGVSYCVHVDNAIPPTDSFKLSHYGTIQILGLGDSIGRLLHAADARVCKKVIPDSTWKNVKEEIFPTFWCF